ncbi:glycosyltransferase [uncultured Spirosoma sp.]|uniref:glycosyltransferase n=1 Tax=uncultured Spirosoma sp. TaxID=278208 RepID=UPI00258D7878|nr:glycosyltransferase [uncultured Spirosoma sp.]
MKNLVLLVPSFEREHLGKDVFLTPYYLGKDKGMDVKIVYPVSKTNRDLPSEVRDVKLIPFKYPIIFGGRKIFVFLSLIYILFNCNRIHFLMVFHLNLNSAIIVSFYKFLNNSGKAYLKMDIPLFVVEKLEKKFERIGLYGYIYKKLFFNLFINVDVLSCETEICFNKISNWKYFDYEKRKIVLMPNGFDEEEIVKLGLSLRDYQNKENIMITVGRLGTSQKNTELLLNSLIGIDLKNWKVILIGSVEDSFLNFINKYFLDHPSMKNSVEFTGNINEKKVLWGYFNKAKVFLMPSKWESYGLVLNEAYRFNNFIISTDVGCAKELIINNNGIVIDGTVSLFKKTIEEIINRDIEIKFNNENMERIFWSSLVKKISI